MSTPVTVAEIAQINEMIGDAKQGNDAIGLLVASRLSAIARDLTRWQWVIHGDCPDYRSTITRWLCRTKRMAAGRRFALCGRGDQIGKEIGGDSVRVRSKGCGARYCPRCSRRYGRRYLKRVNEHLSSRPHGELWHVVFTQRALPGEPLAQTRERFEKAWKPTYRKMQKDGLRGGLATYHLVRTRHHAWHWHCHVIAELKDGIDGQTWFDATTAHWTRYRNIKGPDTCPLWGRLVCHKGLAMVGLANDSQMEMWTESQSEVEKALQYCVRDVLQGVERWIAKVDTPALAEEFAIGVSGAKMHRLLKEWRTKCQVTATEDSEPEAKTSPTSAKMKDDDGKTKVFEWIGTVDWVMYQASRGVETFAVVLRDLVRSFSNQGNTAQRLKAAVVF